MPGCPQYFACLCITHAKTVIGIRRDEYLSVRRQRVGILQYTGFFQRVPAQEMNVFTVPVLEVQLISCIPAQYFKYSCRISIVFI